MKDIDYLTTLAGYIHWKLTGRKVLGVGDASGMIPIDPSTGNYSAEMVGKFDSLIKDKAYPRTLTDILPEVLSAGQDAGKLTPEGAEGLTCRAICSRAHHSARRKAMREPAW